MDSTIYILLAVLTLLVIAGVLYVRARSALTPILEQAAREYGGSVRSTFPGLPQWNFVLEGISVRLTPMTSSTSSPDGGGSITVLDFDVAAFNVADLRVREKVDARRNAVPASLENAGESIEIEHQGFDARFHIHARQGEETKRMLLEPTLFSALLDLPSGADLRIEHGVCHVSVNGHPRDIAFVRTLRSVAQELIAVLRARGA